MSELKYSDRIASSDQDFGKILEKCMEGGKGSEVQEG